MNFSRNLALWIVVALLVFALFNLFQGSPNRGPENSLAFSEFVSEVNRGDILEVTIQGKKISGHFRDGRSFSTYSPDAPNLVSQLTDHGVRITAVPAMTARRPSGGS